MSCSKPILSMEQEGPLCSRHASPAKTKISRSTKTGSPDGGKLLGECSQEASHLLPRCAGSFCRAAVAVAKFETLQEEPENLAIYSRNKSCQLPVLKR